MSERDDLIDLIDGATRSMIDSDVVADAILAAGWVKRGPTEKDAMLDRMLADPDQYYAEEFNGSMITVEQKTAHVKIA